MLLFEKLLGETADLFVIYWLIKLEAFCVCILFDRET